MQASTKRPACAALVELPNRRLDHAGHRRPDRFGEFLAESPNVTGLNRPDADIVRQHEPQRPAEFEG